jgi:hypothetical protein
MITYTLDIPASHFLKFSRERDEGDDDDWGGKCQ